MDFISHSLKKIKPSPTMVITAKARELRAAGEKIISLSAGEPDFDTPEHVKDAAIKAINMGYTKYTNVEGIPELKQAIVNKFKNDNEIDYNTDQVIVGVGGKQILFNALFASLNSGDEVIIPTPYWVSYPDMTILAGGTPKFLNCNEKNDFKINPSELDKIISEKTKWIILNSPSNPSGSCYTKQELINIADILRQHKDVNVITDDIYEYIRYQNDERFYTIAELDEEIFSRTITMNGVSKAYSMTGWRIGYCGGPIEIINSMRKLMGQSTSNPSSISQWATVEALNGSKKFLHEWINSFKERRDFIVNYLNNCKGIECLNPEGAFYVYPSCSGLIGKEYQGKIIENDKDFAMILLKEKLVSVVHGEAFGLSPFFRISYATSMDNIKEACDRIGEFCDEATS